MRRNMLKLLGLLLVTCVLSSCASTTLVDTWRNPNLTAPPHIRKLLVVRITNKDGNRSVYEDVIAAELQKRGVEGVPGHTLIADDKKQNWDTLEEALRKSQADGVLTVQTVNVEKHTSIQPGYPSVYPGYWYPSVFSAWDLRGYYGASTYYDPTLVSTYQVASLQSNLFDAKSGKLIWAATLETSDPEKTISVSKELAQLVVKSLIKEGLI
ncbi:DUF4136 domain-containing protein [Geomonas sp. RF6]|uniref:DUF4136 domain-containing protein n=1 Tax=Geomonas sp. RF6 TaxID=2897342 RepID=UPI001E532F02|nr:DUF4136 domain-containing protein [Geomonas sp. RF6]UFS70919.1 DUF4136 domain-containing protein [Geomonas sp. RF6]